MKRIFALLMATGCSCLALPPNPSTFSNTAPITVNGSPTNTASPYPSSINVTGLTGVVAQVTIQINNVNHSQPSAIGMLLVAPTGQKVTVFSGVGGANAVTNVTVTLDDDAPSALPNGTLLSSGIYQPARYSTKIFPGEQPVGSATALMTFKGINPNGLWRLFIVDDSPGSFGSIAGGWSLTISTGISFTNPGNITINDVGKATPYPSTNMVSGLTGTVNNITLQIYGLSHGYANDIDMLLVSPQGQGLVIWGEAGGPGPITNVNVTLDDSAAQILPDYTNVVSGVSYQPAYYPYPLDTNASDTFPDLPTNIVVDVTYTPMLSTFNGVNPNGAWTLYVVDDSQDSFAGDIAGGWGLIISTLPGPTLNLSLSGPNAILSWPATALGYTLESTTNLADPGSWVTNAFPPTYVSGQNVVVSPLGASGTFYRLIK